MQSAPAVLVKFICSAALTLFSHGMLLQLGFTVKMPRNFPVPHEEEQQDGGQAVEYDYDLFVIGAGSGGVRASRTSAGFGAKVRNPSTHFVGMSLFLSFCCSGFFKAAFSLAGHVSSIRTWL